MTAGPPLVLHLLGVRGSTPAPGPQFVRYGGQTSCVAVGRGTGPPNLVLDAGTGLTAMAGLLDGAPFKGSILLTHLHWDHTHGLPFFAAGDRADAEVDLYLPAQGDPLVALERAMSPPHFPISPAQLDGHWKFHALEAGRHAVSGFAVTACVLPHPGGLTFGYRVESDDVAIAYLPDHGPSALGPGPAGLGPYHEAAMTLAVDADLLIHDAQYTSDELSSLSRHGHSAMEYSLGLAEAAGAREVLMFHHAPGRTDDQLDDLKATVGVGGPVPVHWAVEGVSLVVDSLADVET